MKNPAIHITQKHFESICKELGVEVDSNRFFVLAFKYSLHRVYNGKVPINVSHVNAEKFNFILHSERLKLNHICTPILKQDSAYNTMVDVSILATQFSEAFGIELTEGYKIYIRLGLKMMKDYGVNKFKYYNEKIFTHYNKTITIQNDSSPDITDLIAKYYFSKFSIGFNKLKHYDFILIKNTCDTLKVDYKKWIDFQLEELSYIDIPEPVMLHGEDAENRYKSKEKKQLQIKHRR